MFFSPMHFDTLAPSEIQTPSQRTIETRTGTSPCPPPNHAIDRLADRPSRRSRPLHARFQLFREPVKATPSRSTICHCYQCVIVTPERRLWLRLCVNERKNRAALFSAEGGENVRNRLCAPRDAITHRHIPRNLVFFVSVRTFADLVE